MALLDRSTLEARPPTPPLGLADAMVYQGIGAFLFNGPDTRAVDYAAYLAVPALVRMAANAGADR